MNRYGAPLNSEVEPALQWIEVATSLQIPSFQIIGLPSQEVSEARERVRSAIAASGFEFPRRRIVVNLSPANIRKRGTGIDLGIALALLENGDRLRKKAAGKMGSVVAWGELGLDGHIHDAGSPHRLLYSALSCGVTQIIIAKQSVAAADRALALIAAAEPDLVIRPIRISGASDLREAWQIVHGEPRPPTPYITPPSLLPRPAAALLPLSASLERTVAVAAAGGHHLLLLGPRGTGKSHALEWLIALQPESTPQVRLHQALLEELAQQGGHEAELHRGPVRRVSSYVKPGALLGRAMATAIRPGEFACAHGGLLIADELPEWPRDSREALREPLERGAVTLSRAAGNVELPARFTLAANGNLCPCGGWPPQIPIPLEPGRGRRKPPRCRCGVTVRRQYLGRLSGPVLDRIDLVLLVAMPPRMSESRSATCASFVTAAPASATR